MKHVHKQKGGSVHRCTHERRIARQERAQARKEARSKRSATHQLALLKDRPGDSRKERKKLRKSLPSRDFTKKGKGSVV